ncbi:esterase-like activity of phytase family protein [Acuticoccus mangrovi]|uniref:Esterase-like activity of phytase family protein n=1 Tax=Acuticoccus mangrovi TaxID=2796142 RepID=A0A934IS01_9HYPH|nr:esterase-like activity of phytase family protein [Acuticoccus mangrovi]MBJ3777681.1 esterase-like activity of phytase family protein [Acuticoccus mangrovi]
MTVPVRCPVVVAVLVLAAAPACAESIGALELVGQTTVPFAEAFEGAPVVGISGLTAAAEPGRFYGVSDDTDDSLFYVLDIDLGEDGTSPRLSWVERRRFQNPTADDGRFAPGSLDPEAIAYNPNTDTLLWVSESRGGTGTPVFMHETTTDGAFVREIAIDDKFDHTLNQRADGSLTQGIFGSAGFESLTFAPDFRSFFVAPEDTLVQDGTASKSGNGAIGHARIVQYAETDGTEGTWAPAHEYVYVVSAREDTTSGNGANSLVDLLAVDDTTLLALEREWPDTPGTNPPSRNIKIFEIDLSGATDVIGAASLEGAEFDPVAKRLVLDLDDLVGPDNGVDGVLSYEALIFGPTLADGRGSLIMLNDNDGERDNQLLVFAIEPAAAN